MQSLRQKITQTLSVNKALPFSVYTSLAEQHLLNVPIIKPVLICVLKGQKYLGQDELCCEGHFVFLVNDPHVEMRNIPGEGEYFALLIEFEPEEFSAALSIEALGLSGLNVNCGPKVGQGPAVKQLLGDIDTVLERSLEQFVSWSGFAPEVLWSHRKQELLQLLYYSGHTELLNMVAQTSLSQQVHQMISVDLSQELSATDIAANLAMSESSLRRKLAEENNNLQAIKDQARLGYGLHLIQSTHQSIGAVAERCGYQSQSRFTDKFKQRFGITPSALRKTRLSGSGE